MSGRTIRDRDVIRGILEDPAYQPPARSGQPGGATLALRGAMARFSGPADHAGRRASVVATIVTIDTDAVAAAAARRTAERLRAGEVDAVADIAAAVPTEALAACLPTQPPATEAAAAPASPFDVLAAVTAMVRVIGHGEAERPEVDSAVRELVGRFGVDGASLLYQNRDATAALITTRLAAGAGSAAPAVPRTKRVGIDGDEVTLEIGAAGLPFGAGPHRCPGEALAEAITGAVLGTIADAGYAPDLARAEYDADGRPTRLPLTRR